MENAVIAMVNVKCGNLRRELTKIDSALKEDITVDITKLQAKLEVIIKIQELKILTEKCYKTVLEGELEEAEVSSQRWLMKYKE
ncbi:hypothetical protein NPIL_290151 [Nephila pilipes]|uniref:Uncharacterized protein n=1 Tax=Nephila pilipes TaxID=299642 RepID=A0A8X6QZP8_NEPPI|nr:hypothetical protein NPIL_290151 [Nephila pilipes]